MELGCKTRQTAQWRRRDSCLTHAEHVVGRDGLDAELCLNEVENLARKRGIKEDFAAHVL